jgi:hypothetical protein
MFTIAPRVQEYFRRTGPPIARSLDNQGIVEHEIRFASLPDIASCPCDVCFGLDSVAKLH